MRCNAKRSGHDLKPAPRDGCEPRPVKSATSLHTKSDAQECGAGIDGGEAMTYTVIYEKGTNSRGAYVPELPGVITVGDTREEVEELIREA